MRLKNRNSYLNTDKWKSREWK